MIQALQQNLVNPVGLLAALALIPLIIFYLIRPKPEKEIMPSMTFFNKEEKDGKARNALKLLQRNKMLLLHILFVLIATAAIANPLIDGLGTEGESVILLDGSGSMQGDAQEAAEFAKSNLGQENTVIKFGKDSEVLAEDASPDKARRIIRNHAIESEETDIKSALQTAQNFEGRIILASDLAHTSTNEQIRPRLEALSQRRDVETMNLDHENRWGFTNLQIDGRTAEVTVKNFGDKNYKIPVETPTDTRNLNISSKASKSFQVELSPGLKTLNLPKDDFKLDNKLYISIPEESKIKVSYLGDESRYFREAVELINSTEYVDGFKQSSEVYFVSEDYSLSGDMESKIKKRRKNGAGLILSPEKIKKLIPAEKRSGKYETVVRLKQKPVTSFSSEVEKYSVKGKALAKPEEALVLSQDEKVLLYNVEDKKFGQNIIYPLFWKDVLKRLSGKRPSSSLNLETGENKEFKQIVRHDGEQMSGEVELTEPGFYRGSPTYAANFIDEEESKPSDQEISLENQESSSKIEKPTQKYISVLLAIIATLELIYLFTRGEI
jgi:hypothetical protein